MFINDIKKDALIGKFYRSNVAYAKIISIEYPTIPNGYYILDSQDINNEKLFAKNIINYYKEPICLIAGKDINIINELLNKIKINYELLPLKEYDKELLVEGNNIDNCFLECDNILENTFSCGYHTNTTLEPSSLFCKIENNELDVITNNKTYENKEYLEILSAIAYSFSKKYNKSIQIILDAEEDLICSSKRCPSVTKIKIGIKDNKIHAVLFEINLNIGAYQIINKELLINQLHNFKTIYDIENISIKAYIYKSNSVPNGFYEANIELNNVLENTIKNSIKYITNNEIIKEYNKLLSNKNNDNKRYKYLGEISFAKYKECYGLFKCDLKVDTCTGQVDVLKTILKLNIGNTQLTKEIKNEIETYVNEAIGYCFREYMFINEEGIMMNATLSDYAIAMSLDVHDIDIKLINSSITYNKEYIKHLVLMGVTSSIVKSLNINHIPYTMEDYILDGGN